MKSQVDSQLFPMASSKASEEQISLSDFIKRVHKDLRAEYRKNGESAWQKHVNKDVDLSKYAEAMEKLSEDFWSKNLSSDNQNRISWTTTACLDYFNEGILRCRRKEESILNQILDQNLDIPEATPLIRRLTSEEPGKKFTLLDVGSCFNPFHKYYSDIFEVVAIDIAPSPGTGVLKMDFLNAQITDVETFPVCHNRLRSLPRDYFDCVIFSLVLEYMPSSEQRLKACRNAYEVLDNEGILVIITPDSKHAGANAKLMKNWRYTLALYGFNRIKIEKLQHVTCMIYRKAVHRLVTERWARIHKEPYMNSELNIPQDFEEDEKMNDMELAENLREFCDLKTLLRN